MPLDAETGVPLKATSGMWAVNINGMGIRLAASLTSDGQWNWRTFITGAQVSADCINAGTMRADRIRAGLLTDEVGANYWDLETGEFQLSPSAKYGDGGWTVDGVIEDLSKRNDQNKTDIKNVGDELKKSNESIGKLKDSLGETDTKLGKLQGSLTDLDGTVDDLAKDGVVTAAEKAAVNKILQTIEKEQSELSSEYSQLKSNTALAAQYKTNVLTPRYDAAFGTNGAYSNLKDTISKVTACTDKDALDAAMIEYKSAFTTYSNTVNTYRSTVRQAKSMIEQSNAKATAQGLLDDFDESLTQQSVFNRLTNNGTTQGIYLKNGKVYINATYMATGTIADIYGYNSWNLGTGTLKTKYMTADSITANGTFKCGYTSNYTMLNSLGQMAGYRTTDNSSSASRVGYIDYTASMREVSSGNVYYGIQMQAQGSLRISAPIVSTAASSNTSTTTTYGQTCTIRQPIVSEVHDNGNGTVGWHYGTFSLTAINGFLTTYGTVGTG